MLVLRSVRKTTLLLIDSGQIQFITSTVITDLGLKRICNNYQPNNCVPTCDWRPH